MTERLRPLSLLACLGITASLALFQPISVGAQVRAPLEVTVSDSLDPASTRGQVTYSVVVKNDGTIKALNVVVSVTIPDSIALLTCKPSNSKACVIDGTNITVNFGTIAAHRQVTISIGARMPSVDDLTVLRVTAHANGDQAIDADASQDTTVLPDHTVVVFQPSGREDVVTCGDTLTSDFYGDDDIAEFKDHGLGCASYPIGLRMGASGKTFSLNRMKIIGGALSGNKGNVGIVIADGTTDATIQGGTTNGNGGLEYFDYCVTDEGGNSGLVIDVLRCFRARSTGFDIVSNGVLVSNSLVDLVTFVSKATTDPVGGIGIRAGGNMRVKDTIIRRTDQVGVWAQGSTDPDGNNRVLQMDGNTSTSRIESASNIGIVLDGALHVIKDTYVAGVDGSTDGVVVNGTGITLDGLSVKSFVRGIVVNGSNNQVFRGNVDPVQYAYVVAGASNRLEGNKAHPTKIGYTIDGNDVTLDANSCELGGAVGFSVTGARVIMTNNSAKQNKGTGFLLKSTGALYDTNQAEANIGHGFLTSDVGSVFISNSSQKNKVSGFTLSGTDIHLQTNRAQQNSGSEYVIGAGNVDDGGNVKNGSGFTFTSVGGVFE